MKNILFFILLFNFHLVNASTDNEFSLPRLECAKLSICASQLIQHNQKLLDKSGSPHLFDKGHFSRIHVSSENSRWFFIIAHGLFFDGAQFEGMFDYLETTKRNYLSLVMDGHGYDEPSTPEVKYQNWIYNLENAIHIAEQVADKIVLVGQSTGGLLSLFGSYAFKDRVHGLILVEPAIKVKALAETSACYLPDLPVSVDKFEFLFKLFAKVPERRNNISPQLGCEVVKFSDDFLNGYSTGPLKKTVFHPKYGMTRKPHLANIQKLFSQVDIPISILNHPDDQLVQASWVKYLANFASGPVNYMEVPEVGIEEEIPSAGKPPKDGAIKRYDVKHADPLTIIRMVKEPAFIHFIENFFSESLDN